MGANWRAQSRCNLREPRRRDTYIRWARSQMVIRCSGFRRGSTRLSFPGLRLLDPALGALLLLVPFAAIAADEMQLLQKCLSMPDSTPRVDCYDKIVGPKLSGAAPPIRSLSDCRMILDDDHRRRCYNGFLYSRAARRTDAPPAIRPPADVPRGGSY
jgi:hypothetical protein